MRNLLTFVLAALVLLAAGCSSSTVVDAERARAINEDLPESTETPSGTADDEPDAAATPIPPTPAPDNSVEQEQDRTLVDFEAQWESLAVLCRADDTRACDVLFLISRIDSDYERLASTCNGAGSPASGWCTEGVTTGLDGLRFDESSPGINGIAADCSDGDMMACDFLYFASPSGGQWEEFGDGCGGRTESAFPDCRSEYPDN